jgi:hypothetical protein
VRRLHDRDTRRHAGQRVLTRPLAMADAALQRRAAAEAMIDDHAQHAEDDDPRDPAGGDAVKGVAEVHRAQHGGGEHQKDHADGRAMLVLDVRAAEAAKTVLITAQGICADLIHVVLQTALKFDC